jgi:hypothetical protein
MVDFHCLIFLVLSPLLYIIIMNVKIEQKRLKIEEQKLYKKVLL